MKRARYQSLTIKRKLEIIHKVDSLPPGKKKKDIAAECDIPPSTLSTILKNRDSLLDKHALGSNKKKRYREPTRLEVDAALFQWFTAAWLQSIPISGEILKAKAEELSKALARLRLWNHGLALVDGFPGGKYDTTSSSGAFVAKMPLLIKRFVMTGSRENSFQSYAGMIQATSLMLMILASAS